MYEEHGRYFTFTALTDAGPFLTKLILCLPESVCQGAVTPDTFSVFVRRRNRYTGEIIQLSTTAFSAEALQETANGLSQGWRPVTTAYPCDETGEPVFFSDKVVLEMPYGPLLPLSNLSARRTAMQNDFVQMDIRITQIAPIPGAPSAKGLVFDECIGDICPALSHWSFHEEITESEPFRYAWYEPRHATGKKHPLLIWLHGAGGGGTDPRYPISGNRVTAFSSELAQNKLGAPWIFVPQCPTVWMDDGQGSPLMQSNRTIYLAPLKQAIDSFLAKHRDSIDPTRIWIAGASNGGFMSVLQAMQYPGFYAAAVPVCEAVLTELLTEEDLDHLSKTPLWLVHARGDFVVDPNRTVVPLYKRLKARGADVHFTYLRDIRDESGLFRNRDGTPYRYIPHFAWVPVYNDACQTDYDNQPVLLDGCAVSLQEWLGQQHL